jgi:hypothetical protein
MCEGLEWIQMPQDGNPVVGFCEYGHELSGSIKDWISLPAEWFLDFHGISITAEFVK